MSSSTPPASGDAQPAAPASSAPAASAPASPTGGVEAPAAGSSTHATAIIPSRKAAPGPTAPRASAEELETQGHQLLAQGRYPEALSYLRAALAASGGSIGACATPSTQGCLIYAYALFDIGRALWLSGERGAAIGELEMRLQIDNQRQVVREEIARVRSSKA